MGVDHPDSLAFLNRLGLTASSWSMLERAFVHRSYVNESGIKSDDNERLEFLGDSVLGLSVGAFLYRSFPDRDEGELSRLKSVLVSEESLSAAARETELPRLLKLGRGEERSGGRDKSAILADALEATLGACYLAVGFDQTMQIALTLLKNRIHAVNEGSEAKDYKSLLQVFAQRTYKSVPVYVITRSAGAEHEKEFWCKAIVNGREFPEAPGRGKKDAERAAARAAYLTLGDEL